ncbi:IF-2B domain containing protein [Asbolus verrucosus]|uniref:Translation initiation factor eIF2B subunit beta n=1 Tax=Asbolus verrucosus TaxID=1661398 RepID=A0A482W6V6_ASBVE|nr:IF-2B domain containing protein [Asbolus verrucosus]
MRHILKVIREEYDSSPQKKSEGQSLHHLVTANQNEISDYSESHGNLRCRLLDHLTEYKVELETSTDNIATQGLEHIHTNEIILTVGKSNTVEEFLKYAAKKRLFQVIVVEAAPLYHGHKMAASLAKCRIETTVIPDSAVFAMMSRVNKVIIGTHTVMADGGLRAPGGVHAVALAAKHYSVPVMVLAHMYKLTPSYVCSHETDICASPANVIPYSTGPLLNKIKVYNPIFDYVPPELVTLFISHQGGNAPSYVYRLLSELYHPDDYEL